jgi:hypothetical protein
LKVTLFARIIPIFLITWSIWLTKDSNINEDFLYACVLVQLFFSGLLTTFTFTLMMEISYKAHEEIQASHFSLLSTCEVFGKLLFQPLISFYTDSYGYKNAFILFCFLYVLSILTFYFKRPSFIVNSSNSNEIKIE